MKSVAAIKYLGFIAVFLLFVSVFNYADALSQVSYQNNKCYFIARNLKEGDRGADVAVLQRFLKELGYYNYYNISGYFGPVTKKAVERFQCDQLKICSGTPYTTGYGVFGPKTRGKFNELCANFNQNNSRYLKNTNSSEYNYSYATSIIKNRGEPAPIPKFLKVAEYLFDGLFSDTKNLIVTDTSGNNNHGILDNGAKIYQGARSGGKLELDGIDDRVKVNSKDSLNNLLKFTIAAWIRPENNSGIIIRKGNTNPARFNFGINDKGNLYLRVGYNKKVGVWETVSTVPKNTWTHVAVTYDTTTKMPEFFINGKKQKIITVSLPKGRLQWDTPYMYIGNNHDLVNRAKNGKTSGFKGRMDKIFIFNKVLTDKEIATLAKPEAEVQPVPIPPADAIPMPMPGVIDPPYDQPPSAAGYVSIRGPEYLQVGETGRWTADVILTQPMSRKPSLLAATVCGVSKLFGIKSLCPEENYSNYLVKVNYGDGTNTSFYSPKNQSIILEHTYKIPGTYTITTQVLYNQRSWFDKSKSIATGTKKVYIYPAAQPMPIPGEVIPGESQPPIYKLPPSKDFTPEIKDAKPAPMPRVIVPPNPQYPPQGYNPNNKNGNVDAPVGTYIVPDSDYKLTPEDMRNAIPLMPGVIDQTGPSINDVQPMPMPGVIIEGEPAVWQVQ